MILQSLSGYYKRSDDLPRVGWVRRGVDYVIVLNEEGNCLSIDLIGEIQRGKTVSAQSLVPGIGKQALKHTNSGSDANLLWDNASFVFGTGRKGKQKIASFRLAIRHWLPNLTDAGIQAIDRFCASIETQQELVTNVLARHKLTDEFEKRDPVLCFRLIGDTEHIHARPAVAAAYDLRVNEMANESTLRGNCLISGDISVPIARNETVLKGIHGAQTSGANIISFNERAFESYGKTKRGGENAPVGKSAAFEYTTALNHLLRRGSSQCSRVADTTVVFWSDSRSALESLVPNIFGEPSKDDPDRGTLAITEMLNSLYSGKLGGLEGNNRFHVLGLAAPSKARISIRFYQCSTLKALAEQIERYFRDVKIIRQFDGDSEFPQFAGILAGCGVETSDPKRANVYFRGRRFVVPSQLAGEIIRAILSPGDIPLPPALLNAVLSRCRSEQAKKSESGKQVVHVSYLRASAIKGYLNRWIRWKQLHEKEYEVALDTTNTNLAYRLGRLFAAYEHIQSESAGRELNRTIRDSFFGAAMSTPAAVFPRLVQLNQHHMRNLRREKIALSTTREKLIQEIAWDIDGMLPFPSHLMLQDQGRFAIGYYHQRQALFSKSDKPTATTEGRKP